MGESTSRMKSFAQQTTLVTQFNLGNISKISKGCEVQTLIKLKVYLATFWKAVTCEVCGLIDVATIPVKQRDGSYERAQLHAVGF